MKIFEDRVSGVFGAARAPFSFKKLAKQAAHEMEDQTLVVNGVDTAPALYTILISSADDAMLAQYYPQLTAEVSEFIKAQAEKRHYLFVGEPLVRFMVDPALKPGKFSVFAENVDAPTLGRLYEEERAYLSGFGAEDRIREFDVSSATVELAAKALGCAESRIAKTLSFMLGDRVVLVVAAGDVKVDNRKFKDFFHTKAVMCPREQLPELVGFEAGGVCPFGVNDTVKVYLDESLKRFETVYPAAGSGHAAAKFSLDELYSLSGALAFIDVCKLPQPQA